MQVIITISKESPDSIRNLVQREVERLVEQTNQEAHSEVVSTTTYACAANYPENIFRWFVFDLLKALGISPQTIDKMRQLKDPLEYAKSIVMGEIFQREIRRTRLEERVAALEKQSTEMIVCRLPL